MRFDLEGFRNAPDDDVERFVTNWLGECMQEVDRQLRAECKDGAEYGKIAMNMLMAFVTHTGINAKVNRIDLDKLINALKKIYECGWEWSPNEQKWSPTNENRS